MKLIIQNSDNFVWLQTDGEITQANDVYVVNDVSVGISVTENTIVSDATECPYFEFIAQAYSYTDGVWAIYNQDLYQGQVDSYNQGQKKKRFAAYNLESDPIFFKSQRGEATNQQWLDKIAQIDARYPYQE
jgi:hypothetical protein